MSDGTTDGGTTSPSDPIAVRGNTLHMYFRRLLSRSLVLLGAAGLIVTGLVAGAPPAPAITYTPTFTAWSSGSNGTIGSVSVTLTNNPYSTLTDRDLSGANYVPAGSATQKMSMVEAKAATTISFSSPVTNPALYVKYLRGAATQGMDYALSSTGGSCTWSIQSGLTGASITGSTLIPQATGYGDGVILCAGTVSSFTIDGSADAGAGGAYDITVAALVDPNAPSSSTTTTTVDPVTTSSSTTPPAIDPLAPTFTG